MTGIQGKIRIALRVLLGLMFLAAGAAKLFGVKAMVDEFELFAQFGIGQWFRYVVGIIEISAALMLIRSSTVFYGAAIMVGICAGAFVAQIAVIHQDWVHTIIVGALAAWLAAGYRNIAGQKGASTDDVVVTR